MNFVIHIVPCQKAKKVSCAHIENCKLTGHQHYSKIFILQYKTANDETADDHRAAHMVGHH